jgi:hypothetical protein
MRGQAHGVSVQSLRPTTLPLPGAAHEPRTQQDEGRLTAAPAFVLMRDRSTGRPLANRPPAVADGLLAGPTGNSTSVLFPRDADRLGPASLAVVMGSTVDFGLMRMLHGQIPGDVELSAAIFYSIEDARTWLAELRSASGGPPAGAQD